MVGGAVDRMAVIALALGVCFWWPGAYTREEPLKTWNFTIPMPKHKVERLLVHDFQKTAPLWLKEVESIKPYGGRSSYFVRVGQYDMVVRWRKTAKDVWDSSYKVSPLFIRKRHLRPSPASIEASPGIDWAVEWRLLAVSASETAVQRTIFKLEQSSNRWLPLHRLMPLQCADENVAMASSFPHAV